GGRSKVYGNDIESLAGPAALFGALLARPINEDTTHRFGGRGKKKPSAIPAPGLFGVYQPPVGPMDESRRLKSLSWLFLGEFLGGQLAQFIVDQGQELTGGVRVALLDGRQEVGNIVHRRSPAMQCSSGCGAGAE